MTTNKPLIIHEGTDINKTIEVYTKRAIKEARTVYITSQRKSGNKLVVKIVLEITPQGVLREIPPVGLAVGLLDHLNLRFDTAATKPMSNQRMRHLAGIARMGMLIEKAKEAA